MEGLIIIIKGTYVNLILTFLQNKTLNDNYKV